MKRENSNFKLRTKNKYINLNWCSKIRKLRSNLEKSETNNSNYKDKFLISKKSLILIRGKSDNKI